MRLPSLPPRIWRMDWALLEIGVYISVLILLLLAAGVWRMVS
jgi:hypothetical protein